MYVFMMIFLTFNFFQTFSKKLLTLLMLEGLMLSMIIIFYLSNFVNFYCFLVLMILSVFMVLDSVFGVTILITSSRSTSLCSKFLG